jgi:hypothetical protein
MNKKYEIIDHTDVLLWEVRDEQGRHAMVKNILTHDEADTLKRASQTPAPVGTDNVRIPAFISTDPEGLPPSIPTQDGVLIMGKGEGVWLHKWKKPIVRGDWENLRVVIANLNAQGVHHADIREDNLLVREENGRTCFDIIDWGGPKYCQRPTGKDLDALDRIEEKLVERGLLAADPSKPRKPWRDRIAEDNAGIVLE